MIWEVCDPSVDPDEWRNVGDHGYSRDAVREYLRTSDLDPNDVADMSFKLLARPESDREDIRKVTVRVVPAHFEVE